MASLPGQCHMTHLQAQHLPPMRPVLRPCLSHWRPHRASFICHAAPVATEELKGEELEQWNACQSKVEELGFSADEAVKFLNKAFAWQKGYWGSEKPKPEAPSTAQIDAVISYMDELGVKDKDLASAIKQFPQLLGMKVEERMKPNMTKIEHEFKIKGPAMKNVLKRKPQVTEEEFNQQITEHPVVVVDWMAKWCRKCIYLKPKLERMLRDEFPGVPLVFIDVNSVPGGLVYGQGIKKMPTIAVYQDGEKVTEHIAAETGSLAVDKIRQMIKGHIDSTKPKTGPFAWVQEVFKSQDQA